MIGQTINQYLISAKLGSGGMGEVYLATDTKLDRLVALKFLSEPLSHSEEARQRFFREAQAAASLNHPNIVTIYEVAEHEGRPYFAMEHVDGQSLRAYCSEGNHPVDELIPLINQVGDGIRVAHQSGITHRDLKPENVLINSKGIAKIVDFGLAQIRGAARLTREGSTLGTAAYMSPEQINGMEVDLRTDIWSFGVIVYELLTGRSPYQRDFEQATLFSILQEDPVRPSNLNGAVPAVLENAILRALEKNREKRYAQISQFLNDIAAATVVKPNAASVELGIVVLPFEDISPARDNEYFSDGLTEEIIADLSKIGALRVISRTTAMHYKGSDKNIKAIAGELGVSHVLEGSVRKAGDKLRITAQLIEAATDRHLWAEKFSGTLDDIFEIQEQVARDIARAMELTLTPRETREMASRPIEDARAFDCYLQARNQIMTWSEDGLNRAHAKLQLGLSMVGDNALLFAGMGYLQYQYANLGLRQDDAIRQAQGYVQKSLELDPDLPQAHLVAGLICQAFLGKQTDAVRHLRRVLAVAPNDADALLWLAIGCDICGLLDECAPLIQRLETIDPFNSLTLMARGMYQFCGGDFHQATESFAKSYELEASSVANFLYTLALLYDGRAEDAMRLRHRLEGSELYLDRIAMMFLHSHERNTSAALAMVNEGLVSTARRDPQWSWHMAAAYASAGECEQSLEWLENAVQRGFTNFRMIGEYDPYLNTVQGNPRFEAIKSNARRGWELLHKEF